MTRHGWTVSHTQYDIWWHKITNLLHSLSHPCLFLLILISYSDPPPHFLLFLFFSLSTLHLPPHALLPPLYLQLSFIVRIVPSPDWFVGVDSIDLCDGDQWKENVSLELFPYDAGTDSGFTFSSPNFETIPQDRITQVGSDADDPKPKIAYHVSLTLFNKTSNGKKGEHCYNHYVVHEEAKSTTEDKTNALNVFLTL